MVKVKSSSNKSIPNTNPNNGTINPTTKFDLSSFFTFDNISIVSLFDIFIQIFKILNSILMGISYILLVFQTIYILSTRQPKYINLRHIAIKWLVCILLNQIKSGFTENRDFNSQLTIIILDLIIIAVAYPSRGLKSVHLKYFSHKQQQRYQDSVTDPNQYDITFSSKIFISIAVSLLKLCKHLAAFILPQHRRPIEDALKNLNTVIIDRKCFWSIYNTSGEQPVAEKDKIAIKQYLISGSLSTTIIPPSTSMGSMYNSQIPQSSKQGKQIIKAYGQKCSNITTNGYKPIKRVAIKYMIFQSKLQILDLDVAKSDVYILEQLTEKQGNVLEFMVFAAGQTQSQPIYIKFKNSRELQIFMKSIQQAEKLF